MQFGDPSLSLLIPPKHLQPVHSYESFVSQLSLLPPPQTPLAPTDLTITGKLLCPEITCDINGPHTYHSTNVIPHHPAHIPLLIFGHIPLDDKEHPCPTQNFYSITNHPPFALASGQIVYCHLYGIAHLQDTGVYDSNLRLFHLLLESEGMFRVAGAVLVRRAWCKEGEKNPLLHRLLSFLTCC